LDEYLDVFRHQKLFTCWHVPLQAGSDAVLAHMRRGNTAAEFVELARRFGEALPDGALLTDIIVGYPTETEEDFAATLACLAAAGVAGVNRSNFSARPGTAAARLNPLAPEVIKRRMEQLTARCAQLGRKWHTRWIGRRERVRTVEQKRAGSTIAHNQAGRPVILAGNFPMAQWVTVEYTHAADYHHRAQQSL
jgi:tRNA A37 methylthiotransferase MiaB